MSAASEVKFLLSVPQKIIITTHQRPDGDAIGSSLGLFHYLKKKNQEVHFISPTDYPSFLKWVPGTEEVLIFEKEKAKCAELVEAATLIFCLDFNKLYRLDELGRFIENSKAPKILIDHHLEPDGFPSFQFWRVSASSTSELVYEFLAEMNEDKVIDPVMATCLYTGILTDTDRFRVPTTSPAVHRIVASLLEKGIDHTAVYGNIYESYTENRLRFWGFCVTEKMDIIKELNAGIISIERPEMNRFGIQLGDTEGLVNYPLWIDHVKVSALIMERQGEVKLSLRSKGDFSVEKICREHFGGGGHRNASGGTSYTSVKETKEKLISILALQKSELNPS
ncbi:MAG: bifunctional oligoribonuclease/PAP phosphatase NrnA [Bacteroidetes bacterium]|nr:bifunctional oligoribonuclease/PAP phosphatase NrnA [Bacteroidota bacterium]